VDRCFIKASAVNCHSLVHCGKNNQNNGTFDRISVRVRDRSILVDREQLHTKLDSQTFKIQMYVTVR